MLDLLERGGEDPLTDENVKEVLTLHPTLYRIISDPETNRHLLAPPSNHLLALTDEHVTEVLSLTPNFQF